MRIGVLGAGISGLSFAKLAQKSFEVEVLESSNEYGGIARAKEIDGIAYHPIGGHCFNSKYEEVLSFVFNEVLPKDQWHLINRKAAIRLEGKSIPYPIEYSIKEIFGFDAGLAMNITKDMLNAKDDGLYANLEEWFRKKFGDTLAELYFIPYNAKIWNQHPSSMSPSWVEDKLPIPDKLSFFRGLIQKESDAMSHSSFYYPNSNNQNTFIDALAARLNIVYNYPVSEIMFNPKKNKWIINAEKEYDHVVNTLPLNLIPSFIVNTPEAVVNASKKLKYNKITTMLWETADTADTWTYVPDPSTIFHRYIHIGNFFKPKKNYSITEAVGERSYEQMLDNGKKDPFLLQPLSYNVSDHAYVIFDEDYSAAKELILHHLDTIGLHTLGRFGEWQYYNMDVCIQKSLALFTKIKNRAGV